MFQESIAVEHLVGLVHHQHRALGDHVELRIGDQHRDLDDAVGVGHEAGHLHVDPDEVVRSCCSTRQPCVFSHGVIARLSPGSSSRRSPPRPPTRLWLARRQMRHVRAHRDAVPAALRRRDPARRAPEGRRLHASPRRASACVDALLGAAVAARAHARRRAAAGSSRAWARVVRRRVGIAHGVALIAQRGAAARRCSSCRSTLYRTFVVEAALRLQPHDAGAVPRRPGQAARWSAPRSACRCCVAGAVADGAHGRALVALCLARAGWRFNLLMLLIYPTFIAPLFNKFTPLADEALARAHRARCCARCGFRSSGLFVMDGSQALEPRQRLLHRLRRGQAHRVLRHAARAPRARRGRSGAGARARPLQAPPRRGSAWRDVRAVSLRAAVGCSAG